MVTSWKKFKEILINRKGLGTIGLSDVLGSVISAVFWFFLASVIKPDEYGEIFYFISIVSVAFTLSTVGTLNTTIVFSAKGKQLESTLNAISLLFGVVASLILIIIFYQIDLVVLLFGYIINTLAIGYLLGKKFYSKYAIFVLLQKIFTVIIGISFFYMFGADGIILALGISYFGVLFIIINSYRKSPIKFQEFKKNLRFIWHNYSVKAIGMIKENVDKIIIVPLIGFSSLGNYALALQFIAILSMSNMIIGKYFLIHDSQDVHNKKLKKYFVIFNVCIGIIASISLPIVVPYIFPQFTEIGILAIMSLSVIPTAIIAVKTSELLGNEKSGVVVIGALISSITIVVSMLILVPIFGITGSAISFVLSPSFQAVYYILRPKKLLFKIYIFACAISFLYKNKNSV
jgi:O-antigen/teichoic acid export membrane protein|tara:strand:- start:7 stop:1215 length:1209 start_codon:yes stop_codon:yes gene_type:complete